MRALACAVAMLATVAVHAAEEKLSSVPDDADKEYVTLFGVPGETFFDRMESDLRSPAFEAFRRQYHVNVIDVGSEVFKERYATTAIGDQIPYVMKQDRDGSVIYGEAGYHTERQLRHVFRCRPKPQPQAEPTPLPPQPSSVDVDVNTGPPPAAQEEEKEPEQAVNWLVVILGSLGISGAALVNRFKNAVRAG